MAGHGRPARVLQGHAWAGLHSMVLLLGRGKGAPGGMGARSAAGALRASWRSKVRLLAVDRFCSCVTRGGSAAIAKLQDCGIPPRVSRPPIGLLDWPDCLHDGQGLHFLFRNGSYASG